MFFEYRTRNVEIRSRVGLRADIHGSHGGLPYFGISASGGFGVLRFIPA